MSDEQRLSRQRRSSQAPTMRLMERDIEILKAVFAYRIMRQDQIQQLFFSSRSTAQYRLVRLYQHGFLQRHFLPVYAGWSPTLYTLDKRGIALLRQEVGLKNVKGWDDEVGHEFLSHTLTINDVRVAVTLACRQAGYTLSRWLSERQLKRDYAYVKITDEKGQTKSVSLIPDSYFTIATPQGKTSFFLEVDMGTMTVGRFATKIRAYQAYVRSGAYQQRYQSRSLRVLTTTTSEQRANNLHASAQQIGGEVRCLFTTHPQINPESVFHHSIWLVTGQSIPVALISL